MSDIITITDDLTVKCGTVTLDAADHRGETIYFYRQQNGYVSTRYDPKSAQTEIGRVVIPATEYEPVNMDGVDDMDAVEPIEIPLTKSEIGVFSNE